MNIKKIKLVVFTAIIFLACFGIANQALAALPTVATNNADEITSWSARMNGEIIATGEDDNDERGFEWGTSPGVYTSWWTETGSFVAGTFSRSIGGLTPGQTYYYRVKSYNSFGWAYGAEKSFTALSYTYPSYGYTYYSSGIATSQNILEGLLVGGILSFDYTATVPADTTLKVQFSQDGASWYSSAGTAGSWDTLSGGINNINLLPLNWNGSNFYYKMEFTSDATQNATPEVDSVTVNYAVLVAPTVVTNNADTVTSWSARMNGEMTDTGGADNDERGFEWGTTSGVYTSWWTETGIFTPETFSRSIGGLAPSQTYYYRAKSHNAAGWSYGVEKSFTTLSYTFPTYDYTYYASGTATSQNILEGLSVAQITSFDYTATVPADTTLKIQFSQDNANWYSSAGTLGAWDTCSDGIHNIDLSALIWKGPNFYYKMEFTADAAQTATPEVDSVTVNYAVPVVPTVVTNNADEITSWSARMNGEMTVTGGDDNDERGFEWGTTPGVYTSWWTKTGIFTPEAFNHSIGGLTPGKTYYYRAKSHNSIGWGYGAEKSFTTSSYTYPSYSYTYYTSGIATSQNVLEGLAVGNIISFDYTATVPADTTLKIQFSQDSINWHSSTAAASGWDTLSSGTYNISLLPLNWNGPNFYYKLELTADVAQNITPEVDWVAVNHIDTAVNAPTVTTQVVSNIKETTITGGGDITDTGGENCNQRGVEWGTASGSYTQEAVEDGSFGAGTFTTEITGLIGSTTYYYRAKAHNFSAGWGYGSEQSFITSSHNVFGAAWSDNIGWISFNSSDCDVDGNGFVDAKCGGDNTTNAIVIYGVSIDGATGDFSGQAWSDNIGWISFNAADIAGCPSGTCQPNLAGDDTVSGWAKALSADGLGWDGWIKLSDTVAPTYGVTLNTGTDEFEGFAWGGDVVGWVSFNCIDTASCGTSDYAVVYSLPNILPTSGITSPAAGDYSEGASIPFAGWGSDTDGSVVAAEWRDYGAVTAVGDCDAGNIISTAFSAPNSSFSTSTLSLGDHNICFRVQDDDNMWSEVAVEHVRAIKIIAATECSDGVDNDTDGYIDTDDPGCHTDYDPTNAGSYVSTDTDEGDEPACFNSVDDDNDGLIDTDDPGCHSDGDPTNAGSYNKLDNDENNCGSGVCEIGETYVICPSDCPFLWIEF